MKRAFLTLIVMALLGTAFAQSRAADSIAVRRTLGRFGQSFAKGDFSDMDDYTTPDVNWINIVGMHWHNRKEVQYAHQVFVKTVLKNLSGKAKNLSTTIRFITDDVALAYVRTRIEDPTYPPGNPSKDGVTDDIATYVLVKQNGKWLIASAENVVVVAAAAAHDPVLQMK